MNYEFRAYCDICNRESPWFNTKEGAIRCRELHFESTHPDNPMVKENCRIQRRNVE